MIFILLLSVAVKEFVCVCACTWVAHFVDLFSTGIGANVIDFQIIFCTMKALLHKIFINLQYSNTAYIENYMMMWNCFNYNVKYRSHIFMKSLSLDWWLQITGQTLNYNLDFDICFNHWYQGLILLSLLLAVFFSLCYD